MLKFDLDIHGDLKRSVLNPKQTHAGLYLVFHFETLLKTWTTAITFNSHIVSLQVSVLGDAYLFCDDLHH